ncbi:helix-turn-helix domain-containing protein [Yoonia sp. GPGPB17]|uniref:winged helix-turn-helix transcriptional regulator n=1 Tax=Yoonia sp. GPGPB17 TaxID=3026147 RepID=UPI0030BB81FC
MQSKLNSCGNRSKCPINALVEVVGDQWSLLILRDMIFSNKSHFSEFKSADEGVATNILSARLNHLITHGLVEKFPDPVDGRASIYLPTDRALDLIPVLLAAMAWSEQHMPDTKQNTQVIQAYRADPKTLADMVAANSREFRRKTLK